MHARSVGCARALRAIKLTRFASPHASASGSSSSQRTTYWRRCPPGPAQGRAVPFGAARPGQEMLGAILATELRGARLSYMPGRLNDGRDLRVGQEALEAFLVPVEDHPNPVGLRGIAKDGRAFGPVLLSLIG